MNSGIKIIKVLDPDLLSTDHGATSHNRFGYQSFCVALYAMNFFCDECLYDEICCELDDDIRIKNKADGSYFIIQVKTRNHSGGPFKFTDDEIKKTVRHFFKLHQQNGDQISRYIIASNVGLAKRSNYQDVNHVRELVRGSDFDLEVDDSVPARVRKTVFGEAEKTIDLQCLCVCLAKIYGDEELPKLLDERAKLTEILSLHFGHNVMTNYMTDLANDIVAYADRYSSKQEEHNIPGSVVMAPDPGKAEQDKKVESRTITPDNFKTFVLERYESYVAATRLVQKGGQFVRNELERPISNLNSVPSNGFILEAEHYAKLCKKTYECEEAIEECKSISGEVELWCIPNLYNVGVDAKASLLRELTKLQIHIAKRVTGKERDDFTAMAKKNFGALGGC